MQNIILLTEDALPRIRCLPSVQIEELRNVGYTSLVVAFTGAGNQHCFRPTEKRISLREASLRGKGSPLHCTIKLFHSI